MLTLRSRFTLLFFPLLTAAVAAPACKSSVNGTGGTAGSGTGTGTSTGTGAGGASGGCPSDTPENGSACPGLADGTACQYTVPCCADTIATCNNALWDVQGGPCLGVLPKTPAPVCPQDPPDDGTPCDASCEGPLTCNYGTCSGSMQPAVTATCEGTWSVTVQCDAGIGGAGGGGAGGGG